MSVDMPATTGYEAKCRRCKIPTDKVEFENILKIYCSSNFLFSIRSIQVVSLLPFSSTQVLSKDKYALLVCFNRTVVLT